MKNWKTTVCGVSIILGVICAAIASLTDNDPSTMPDIPTIITTIVATLGGMGLILARDGKDGGVGH